MADQQSSSSSNQETETNSVEDNNEQPSSRSSPFSTPYKVSRRPLKMKNLPKSTNTDTQDSLGGILHSGRPLDGKASPTRSVRLMRKARLPRRIDLQGADRHSRFHSPVSWTFFSKHELHENASTHFTDPGQQTVSVSGQPEKLKKRSAEHSVYPSYPKVPQPMRNYPIQSSHSQHEALSGGRNERMLSRNSHERARSPNSDQSRPPSKHHFRAVHSRVWNEDQPSEPPRPERELDGVFRFVATCSGATWAFLRELPSHLRELPHMTIQLLQHLLPCLGRPRPLEIER